MRRLREHETPMPTREHEIEITGPTVLKIGGYRITIEPDPEMVRSFVESAARLVSGRDRTVRDSQVAEAELRKRTRTPFEPESASKVERLSFVPRAGGSFRAVGGLPTEIARVVGRDGSLWFVLDAAGRPFALRRVDLAWHATPVNPTAPASGDVIVHSSAESSVAEVIGKAEVGGWVVKNNAGVSLHVLRSDTGRWMSLGMAEVRA